MLMLLLKRMQKKKFLPRNRTFNFALFFIFFLQWPLSAGAAYIEPYLGNISYDLSQDRGDTQDASLKPYAKKGTLWGGGLRYGPSFRPFFVGVDVSYYLMSRVDSATGEKKNETIFLFGPIVAYELRVVPLRVWLGFNYIDRFRYTNAKMFTGTSLKAGVGVELMPKVSFNFEMSRHHYTRVEEKGGVTGLPTTDGRYSYQEPEMTSLMLSLSFPFW